MKLYEVLNNDEVLAYNSLSDEEKAAFRDELSRRIGQPVDDSPIDLDGTNAVERVAKSTLGAFGQAFVGGAQWLTDYVPPISFAVGALEGATGTDMDENFQRSNKILADSAKEQVANRIREGGGYGEEVATAAGVLAPAVGATLAAKSPAVGARIMSAQVFGQTYSDEMAKGTDSNKAFVKAGTSAALERLTEAYGGLGVMGKIFKGEGRGLVSRLAEGASREAVEEGVNSAANDAADYLLFGEKKSLEDVGADALHSAAVAAPIGFGMAAVAAPSEIRYEKAKAELKDFLDKYKNNELGKKLGEGDTLDPTADSTSIAPDQGDDLQPWQPPEKGNGQTANTQFKNVKYLGGTSFDVGGAEVDFSKPLEAQGLDDETLTRAYAVQEAALEEGVANNKGSLVKVAISGIDFDLRKPLAIQEGYDRIGDAAKRSLTNLQAKLYLQANPEEDTDITNIVFDGVPVSVVQGKSFVMNQPLQEQDGFKELDEGVAKRLLDVQDQFDLLQEDSSPEQAQPRDNAQATPEQQTGEPVQQEFPFGAAEGPVQQDTTQQQETTGQLEQEQLATNEAQPDLFENRQTQQEQPVEQQPQQEQVAEEPVQQSEITPQQAKVEKAKAALEKAKAINTKKESIATLRGIAKRLGLKTGGSKEVIKDRIVRLFEYRSGQRSVSGKSYKELQLLAKEFGIKANGTKAELIERITGGAHRVNQSTDYNNYSYKELQVLAKDRGLKAGGKKADLVQRLQKNDAEADVRYSRNTPETSQNAPESTNTVDPNLTPRAEEKSAQRAPESVSEGAIDSVKKVVKSLIVGGKVPVISDTVSFNSIEELESTVGTIPFKKGELFVPVSKLREVLTNQGKEAGAGLEKILDIYLAIAKVFNSRIAFFSSKDVSNGFYIQAGRRYTNEGVIYINVDGILNNNNYSDISRSIDYSNIVRVIVHELFHKAVDLSTRDAAGRRISSIRKNLFSGLSTLFNQMHFEDRRRIVEDVYNRWGYTPDDGDIFLEEVYAELAADILTNGSNGFLKNTEPKGTLLKRIIQTLRELFSRFTKEVLNENGGVYSNPTKEQVEVIERIFNPLISNAESAMINPKLSFKESTKTLYSKSAKNDPVIKELEEKGATHKTIQFVNRWMNPNGLFSTEDNKKGLLVAERLRKGVTRKLSGMFAASGLMNKAINNLPAVHQKALATFFETSYSDPEALKSFMESGTAKAILKYNSNGSHILALIHDLAKESTELLDAYTDNLKYVNKPLSDALKKRNEKLKRQGKPYTTRDYLIDKGIGWKPTQDLLDAAVEGLFEDNNLQEKADKIAEESEQPIEEVVKEIKQDLRNKLLAELKSRSDESGTQRFTKILQHRGDQKGLDEFIQDMFSSYLEGIGAQPTVLEQKALELVKAVILDGRKLTGKERVPEEVIRFLKEQYIEADIADAKLVKSQMLEAIEWPEYLRKLWGEVKNPILKVQSTANKVANLNSNLVFEITLLKQIGSLFSENPQGEHLNRVGSYEELKRFKVLGKLYTTDEGIAALKAYVKDRRDANYNLFAKSNSLAKKILTVYNVPKGAIMNLYSAVQQLTANGVVVEPLASGKWIKAIAQNKIYGTIGEDLSPADRVLFEAALDRSLLDGGLVIESMDFSNELEFDLEKNAGIKKEGRTKRVAKAADRIASETFSFPDEWGKLVYFADAIKKEAKRRGINLKDEEAMIEFINSYADIAASETNDVMLNFQELPPAVAKLSRDIFFGTFVSFPIMLIMNTYNTYKIGIKELSTPGKMIQGAKRLSMASSMLLLTYALGYAAKGGGDDDEEGMRELFGDFYKYASKIFLSDDEALVLDSVMPYSVFMTPMNAMMNGDFAEGLSMLLSPYYEPGFGVQIMNTLIGGVDQYGNKVDQAGDNLAEVVGKRGFALMKQLGASNTIVKMVRALIEDDQQLFDYKMKDAAYTAVGLKYKKIGKKALRSAIIGNTIKVNTASKNINRAFIDGSIDNKEFEEIVRREFTRKIDAQRKIFAVYRAMLAKGKTEKEAYLAMIQATGKRSRKMLNYITSGEVYLSKPEYRSLRERLETRDIEDNPASVEQLDERYYIFMNLLEEYSGGKSKIN